VILLDANIPMYAAGRVHPCKEPSLRVLRAIAEGTLNAAVDAEVLQEILHRYRAIDRWDDGLHVYRLLRVAVPTTLPITAKVLDRARDLMVSDAQLLARDAVHAAVCLESGAAAFCSYDRDFDRVVGIVRRTPEELVAA